jgi:hypothetical protein
MKEYLLKGSADNANIERRISLLSSLLQQAEQKITHISELRQRNINYALVIFAGLFTFTLKFTSGLYSLFVSVAMLAMVAIFCMLDRRLHKFIHGWGKTKTEFMECINTIINNPSEDIKYQRYYPDGERTAELKALQPMIFYFLLIGGFVHLVYIGVSWATTR